MDSPLRPLVTHWLKKIRLAWDFKKEEFQDDADVGMAFFDGPYEFMYGLKHRHRTDGGGFTFTGDLEDLPRPSFCMTVNKVAEMVQLFGPVLYHRNPVRQVNPRVAPMVPPDLFGPQLQDPLFVQQYLMMDQQVAQMRSADAARAKILEAYLNYTPTALDLKTESRWAIDEAIIKGMGVLWTELYQPPYSPNKMVGSFFDTADNLVIDSDAESIRDAKWVARRCVHPVWQFERDYGLPPGTIKGHLESHDAQARVAVHPSEDYKRKQGLTNDLVVYWKVWSKMGLGGRLAGITPSLREPLEQFGDWCYLVVCDRLEYPANLPPEVQAGPIEQAQQACQWPTPFWADDTWPFTGVLFHSRPRKLWPMSHLKPGLGELKFINWVYSFIAGKIKVACRDFLAMKKSLSEEIKSAILHGTDYELVEIDETHGTIKDVVEFLQHPPFQGDIWRVLQAVEENFEKRVGLTELMYGQSRVQLRSASEAQVKSDQLRIRPDDMANKVEDAMTDLARKEALACRWHLTGQDVAPVLGPAGGQFWDMLVTAADPSAILHQLEYRIEAGSTRKPNKDRDAANMQQAMQSLFQPLFQLAMQSGQVGPVNALLTDWARSIDLDAGKYTIQPPPPPAPPEAGGGGPPPEQGAAA